MKRILIAGITVLLLFSLPGIAGDDLKYELGKKVASLTLKDLIGKEFDLEKTLAGKDVKGIVFVFVSYKCPASIASDSRYVKHALDFNKEGILFVGINANMRTENPEDMKKHAGNQEYPFPVLWDEGSVIADRFDAKTTPHAFFVDKESVLRYKGQVDDSVNDPKRVKETTLANVVGEYLAGKELSVTETKPDG